MTKRKNQNENFIEKNGGKPLTEGPLFQESTGPYKVKPDWTFSFVSFLHNLLNT